MATQSPKLDYTLNSAEERTKYITQLLSNSTSTPPPTQLEFYADYILHAIPSLSLAPNEPNLPLQTEAQHTPPSPTKYTKPRYPIPWNSPQLGELEKDIKLLLQKAEEAPSPLGYRLRRWARELRMDARARLGTQYIEISPTFSPSPPPDIDLLIDWTNPFHIKHLIRHYSELRQSNSQSEIEYLDYLVEKAQLPAWQEFFLLRYIDGENSISVAVELATKFDKPVSPGYTSQVLRKIYRRIAQIAELDQLEKNLRHTPSAWAYCPGCGEKKLIHEEYWWRGKTKCKKCAYPSNKNNKKNAAPQPEEDTK